MSYSAFTPRYIPAFPNKDPSDSLIYAIDFSKIMAKDGDTIASVTEVVSTPTGLTITEEVVVGQVVSCRIAGGTSGTRYLVDATIETTGGNTYTRGGTLLVIPR